MVAWGLGWIPPSTGGYFQRQVFSLTEDMSRLGLVYSESQGLALGVSAKAMFSGGNMYTTDIEKC